MKKGKNMRKLSKKWLACLLAVALMLTLFPVAAFAAAPSTPTRGDHCQHAGNGFVADRRVEMGTSS